MLHAALDFRRVIDVPGYERIALDDAARFIGTMNYGYAGTRELNEALDLRGLLSALHLIEKGISTGDALRLGIINKAFEPFERQLVADAVWARIPRSASRAALFNG